MDLRQHRTVEGKLRLWNCTDPGEALAFLCAVDTLLDLFIDT